MGNGPYQVSFGPDWWKLFAADINAQAEGWGIPDQGLDATMTISPGSMTTPAYSGQVNFNFNKILVPGWDIGTLTCISIYPLCGVNPNDGAAKFYEYSILKITDGELRLCAPMRIRSLGWSLVLELQEEVINLPYNNNGGGDIMAPPPLFSP